MIFNGGSSNNPNVEPIQDNCSGSYDFFSSSFFSSSSFIDDLKLRIPSQRLLPRAANLLGPNKSRAIATTMMISGKPIFPIKSSNRGEPCRKSKLRLQKF